MYSIHQKPYGYYVLIEGRFDEAEATQLREDVRVRLSGNTEEFSAIVDIRRLVPPHPVCQQLLCETIDFAFKMGMKRVAAIYNSPVVRDLLKQIAFQSGRDPVGRYIDASRTEDPVQMALDYVENGVEPLPMTQKIRITAG